jgi:SSS family transporter
VAGSIIATEISAVTFVSVPAIVYAAGGDLTYLQLAIGALLARVIIGLWFVPAFYRREIYSPYDYMGDWLGQPARTATTGLFMLGAVLGQSVRVLLTALILELMTGLHLGLSIWIIGAVAVAWTLLGGITTVIWTDVIQFFVFLLALGLALVFVVLHVPGGWSEVTRVADQAGKLRLWNLSSDPNVAFTLWAALIGNTLLCLNAYGTDQMIAQRMFCCRGPRQASLAIISSSVGLLVTTVALLVGLGLYAFYQHRPLDPTAQALVAKRVDRIFPIFIVQVIPPGLTGLIIAGVFAAAISSLDSVLAALSQTVVTGFYRPWREHRGGSQSVAPARRDDDRHYVVVSKLVVVAWGIVLCLMAQVSELAYQRYRDILDLALAMATYTGGGLLAAFCLAFFRLNVDYRGIVWAAPISVLTVFAVSWHQPWAQMTTAAVGTGIAIAWYVSLRTGPESARGAAATCGMAAAPADHRAAGRAPMAPLRRDVLASTVLTLAVAAAVFVCSFNYLDSGEIRYLTVAWPWNVPIGFVVALVLGYLLARPRTRRGSQSNEERGEP